jgi:diguanylate cyclase (GGDEF)-like protein
MEIDILVIESDHESAEHIQRHLTGEGFRITVLDPEALGRASQKPPSFHALLFAEDSSLLTFAELRRILALDDQSAFVILLGTDRNVHRAVDAMLEGAFAYLTKPVSGPRLRSILKKGLANRTTFHDIMQLATRLRESNRELERHERSLLREKRHLQRTTRQLRFLQRLSLAIGESLDPHQIMDQVFIQLRDELGVYGCGVRLSSADAHGPQLTYTVGTMDESHEVVSLPLNAAGRTIGTMQVAFPRGKARQYRQLFDTASLHIALVLQNATRHAEIKQLADRDPLTRLDNRRSFERQLLRELGLHRRYRENLSLLLCDLDHFKEVNDRYGHQTGDQVLRQMARLMQETFRNCDYLARWGGDEFAVILPRTTKKQAFHCAERLRRRLRQPLLNSGRNIKVSASIGIADTGFPVATTEEKLIALADQALYKAKEAGRSRIRLSGAPPHCPPSDHHHAQAAVQP